MEFISTSLLDNNFFPVKYQSTCNNQSATTITLLVLQSRIYKAQQTHQLIAYLSIITTFIKQHNLTQLNVYQPYLPNLSHLNTIPSQIIQKVVRIQEHPKDFLKTCLLELLLWCLTSLVCPSQPKWSGPHIL